MQKKFLLGGILVLGLFLSVQAKDIYVDEFSGWRDETTNPGFNAKISVDKEKNIGTIAIADKNTYGKVMSAESGITIDINDGSVFTCELLNDIPEGSMTVDLMTAGEPYDSHKIIAKVDKEGVYSAKIAEKTPWGGKHTFWIECWLEGTNKSIARITNIKITGPGADVKVKKKKKKQA